MASKRSRGQNSQRPTALALFAGAGGLALGFHQTGFDILAATDIDAAAAETHATNWPDLPFIRRDVRELSPADILDVTNGARPDVIVGGPPCQGFSTLGAKLSGDPRNQLFEDYARIVHGLQPKLVVLENVRSIATMYGGRYKDHVISRFEDIGYKVHFAVLDAANFGVPQHRLRAFFVATRLDEPFDFPLTTHGLDRLPYECVGNAIMDLADPAVQLNGHTPLNHSDTVVARYRTIPEGGRLPPPEELPVALRRRNFGNTYKRLHRGMPSLTLVPGNNAFPVHPVLDRSLTPREAARLQTFPDSYQFVGDRRRQCILVGNAVPPRLAQAMAQAVKAHLSATHDARRDGQAIVFGDMPAVTARTILNPDLNALPVSRGFVDLFSGAGGFTLGFARAGLRPIVSADLNPFVAETHRYNFPDTPFVEGDLVDPAVRARVQAETAGESPFVVVGGPPCQGFSIFGKRRFVNTRNHQAVTDPRNKLVFAFVDCIAALMPRWVVMENVAGISTLDNGSFLTKVEHDLRDLGYSTVEHRILNCADYGVPQLRKRFVLIANRTGHVVPWPKQKFYPSPQEWQKPHRTVGEAITDLAAPESHDNQTCHTPMRHKPLLEERFQHIREGERLDVDSLPKHLQKGYRTDQVKNYSHVFKRLHRARPSITMVPGHNAFPIHPWLNRALTVREAARIQTFPDGLEFRGPRQEQCIQVGNAFPPLLAELIANNILKAETNGWFPGEVPKSALYSIVDLASPLLEVASTAGR